MTSVAKAGPFPTKTALAVTWGQPKTGPTVIEGANFSVLPGRLPPYSHPRWKPCRFPTEFWPDPRRVPRVTGVDPGQFWNRLMYRGQNRPTAQEIPKIKAKPGRRGRGREKKSCIFFGLPPSPTPLAFPALFPPRRSPSPASPPPRVRPACARSLSPRVRVSAAGDRDRVLIGEYPARLLALCPRCSLPGRCPPPKMPVCEGIPCLMVEEGIPWSGAGRDVLVHAARDL